MAVRQYIGARYTIKVYENSQDPHSAEWEPNTNYEPITLVTFQNSSYLSKKEVPPTVGNPADNPAYWVITGAYNGQILVLQQQIDNLDLDRRSAHIFESVSDMMASDLDFEDDAIISIGNGSFFKVVTASNAITKALSNGKYAELLPDDAGFYHIGALELATWADIYPIISYLFSNGNYYIYIENGQYSLSDTILLDVPETPQIKIIGESKTKTHIVCTHGFLKVTVDGYRFRASEIKNLFIEGTPTGTVGGDYEGIDLVWANNSANDMLDYLVISDIMLQYFNIGFKLTGRVIWSNFTNMTIRYNKIGMQYYMADSYTNAYFNNNVFTNCEFDSNLNYGINFRGLAKHAMSNIFIGCSIEGNNYGDTTTSNLAEMVLIGLSATFLSCHFEKASNVSNYTVVVPVRCNLQFKGCFFLKYSDHMLTNTTSLVVFDGSTESDCSETVYGSDTGTTVFEHTYTIA